MKLHAWTLVGALSLSACGTQSPKDTVKIGALLSTTGGLAGTGNEQLEAVQLAVSQINEAGGVLGRELELVHRDDATDGDKGRAGAAALVESGVSVVIGPAGSAVALSAFESLRGKQVVGIGTSSTSPLLSTLDDDGYFFRTCASDAGQGKVLAKRALAKGLTKVAILYIPGAYGEGLADSFEAAFTEAGGTITFQEAYEEGQPSYNTLLTRTFEAKPQAVLLVAYPVDGAQIIEDYNTSFSLNGVTWFFTDGLADPDVIKVLGSSNFFFAHEGTRPGTPTGSVYENYVADFKARVGSEPAPGFFSSNAYDAVFLTALAMTSGGALDGTTVRDQLPRVSSEGKPFNPEAYADAVAELEAGGDIDYVGASGAVDFDTYGDAPAPYDIWKVNAGQMVTVEANVSP